MSTKKKLPAHSQGTGNIFADLGLPNAEEQADGKLVVGPGIPPSAKKLKDLITTDKLTM